MQPWFDVEEDSESQARFGGKEHCDQYAVCLRLGERK